MGVVAPNGIGIPDFWESLVQGRSGIRRITRFDASSYPCQIAGEVSNFDPTKYIEPKIARRLDRFAHYAIASASMAFGDTNIGLPHLDPYRFGVFVGAAVGGGETIETQHLIFIEKGFKRIAPYTSRSIASHTVSAAISESFGLRGPNSTIASGCNGGLDVTYMAYNAIRLGDADVMVASVGEAPISPFSWAVSCAVGVMANRNEDPKGAVRPYDADATGMVLGEGGGSIVLEELQHALNRGARIYGEILGYSSTSEANLWSSKTEIEALSKAFEITLQKSGLCPADVDYINGHGNGIPSYDLTETEAIKKVFGEIAYRIPISSIKPLTGQSFTATGMYQIITSLLVLEHGIVPPTLNHRKAAPGCDLNYVPGHAIEREAKVALMNAHAFGGRHTVLSVGKLDHP